MQKQNTYAINLDLDNSKLAGRYEAVSNPQYEVGKFLLGKLNVISGDYVLDVGCGTGRLASFAAAIVGDAGRVVGIDPLKDRIDIASKVTRPNLSFEVGDAHDLSQFAPGSFDVVYLNTVFHWLSDQPEALLQVKRVLKKGGRIGISTGSLNHPPPYQEIKEQVLSRQPFQDYQEKGVENFPSQHSLELLLGDMGFHGMETVFKSGIVVTGDADAMISWSDASSFGNFLGHLPEKLRSAARDEMRPEYEKLRTSDGISMEIVRMVTVATNGGPVK